MSSKQAAQHDPNDPWVAVAKILRPHGLGGTMRLQPFSRSPEDLLDAPVRHFHIRRGTEILGPFTLGETRVHQGIIFAEFDEIHDRTAAEQFTNAELVIPEDQLWDPPEGMYYIHELRGLEVRDAQTHAVIGSVRNAEEGLAHDYLILDLVQKRGVMLPLIPMYVPEVNIEGGFVEVVIPPGLVD